MIFDIDYPPAGTPFRQLNIYEQKLIQIYEAYKDSPLMMQVELQILGPYKGRGKGGRHTAKSAHAQSRFTRNMHSKYSPKIEDRKHGAHS